MDWVCRMLGFQIEQNLGEILSPCLAKSVKPNHNLLFLRKHLESSCSAYSKPFSGRAKVFRRNLNTALIKLVPRVSGREEDERPWERCCPS